MQKLDKKQIFIGTILGIILSILTFILLTRNIQPLSAQGQQSPQFTVFKTAREGFKFLKQNPIGGRNPAEYAPIFAQTPTSGSPVNQVATKEYVDKSSPYPYWVLAEHKGVRYFIPAKRSPQLKTTDWLELESNTGWHTTTTDWSNWSISSSGSDIIGYSHAESSALSTPIIRNILGKQIYKIEVKRYGNSYGACSFGILGKIGIIWTATTSAYRNPLQAEVSYDKRRDWFEDVNLGGWWSRKRIAMGEITSYNYNLRWWEDIFNIEFFNQIGNTKYVRNSGGIDYLAYIKSFPAYNYLVIDSNDIIVLDSLIVRRDGEGKLNCSVRFTYYDDYMPTNIINPDEALKLPRPSYRLRCRRVSLVNERGCRSDEQKTGEEGSIIFCCSLIYD